MYKILRVKKISIALILIFLVFYGYYKKSRSIDILRSQLPLFSQIGIVNPNKTISEAEDKEGFLIYGPYLPMKEGSYAINFKLSLPNLSPADDPQRVVGFCDVNVVDSPQYNARYDLKLKDFQHKNPHNVALKFFVPPNMPKVEFRVFQNNGQNISLQALRLFPTNRFLFVLLKRFIKPNFLYIVIGLPIIFFFFWIARRFLKVKPALALLFFCSAAVLQYGWLNITSVQNILKGSYAFSTQIGTKDAAKNWFSGQAGGNGFLVYGPYMPLGEGTYEVLYSLSFDNMESVMHQSAGYCDVNIVDVPHNYVKKELIRDLFKNGKATVKIEFSIPPGTHATEFRVFQYGGSVLTLRGLSLKPATFIGLISPHKQRLFQNIIYMCGALLLISLYIKFILMSKDRKMRNQYLYTTLLSIVSGLILAWIWSFKGYNIRHFNNYYDMWRVFYAPVWLPLVFVFFNFLYRCNDYFGFSDDLEKYRKYDLCTQVIFPVFILAALFYKNFNSQFVLGNFYLGVLLIKSVIYFLFFWQNLKNRQNVVADKNFKWLFFGSVFTIYLLITPWVNAALHTEGDETAYLIKTQSIVNDLDLHMTNNVQDGGWISFHPNMYWTQINGQHSNSGPSFIFVPGFWVGGRFGATLTMNVIGSLLALNIFLIVYYLLNSVKISYLAALMGAFTCPLGIYSFLIFPELIAAFILVYILRKLLELSTQNQLRSSLLIICAAILLIMLKERYIFLTVIAIASVIYAARKNLKIISLISLVLAAATAAFVLFDKITYGLSATDRIVGNAKVLLSRFNNIFHGTSGMIGLWLDQEVGLFIHNPLYVFSFLGMVSLFVNKTTRKKFFMLMVFFVPTYMFIAFNYDWSSDGSPAPRYIVSIIPILVIAFSAFLYHLKKVWLKVLTLGCLGWSFLFYYVFMVIPQYRVHNPNNLTGRNELLERLYLAGLPDMANVFPALLKPVDTSYFLLVVYSLLFILLLVLYLKQARQPHESLEWRCLFRKGNIVTIGMIILLVVSGSSLLRLGSRDFQCVECYVAGGYRWPDHVMLNGKNFFVNTKIGLRRGQLVTITTRVKGDNAGIYPVLSVMTGNDMKKVLLQKVEVRNKQWREYKIKYIPKENAVTPFWFVHENYNGENSLYLSNITFVIEDKENDVLKQRAQKILAAIDQSLGWYEFAERRLGPPGNSN